MADRYLCVHCRKPITATTELRFRKHGSPDPCMGSGEFVPPGQVSKGPIAEGSDPGLPEEGRDYAICYGCGLKVRLADGGAFALHTSVFRGARCPTSGSPYRPPETSCQSNGDSPASSGSPSTAPASTTSPASAKTPTPKTSETTTSDFAAMLDTFQQPPQFLSGNRARDVPTPMTPQGAEIAGRLKEMFFDYNNRRSEDNRSAQTTLGPSEIGADCDRRLAMSLLRVVPVNPGGDGWAAFVGTQIHAGLADMFTWANANTGRYAVEVPFAFPSEHVPRGTGDLLDRTLLMFADHKAMGQWSLNKLRNKGPSPTYRVQVHTYAYGARLKGEKVDHVAIIGWPRDASSLDDLHVWVEKYDASIARDALARVDRIAEQIKNRPWRDIPIDSSDCRFCPYHAPGDANGERGCDGKT